jgi:hypothetical protein
VRAPAPVGHTQLQLIAQQPNGPIWIRICAKLNIEPSLQQVHQYDSALKLVVDNGHQASEEIYTCIVSEHQKHMNEQKRLKEQQLKERQLVLAMARAPSAKALLSAFQASRGQVPAAKAPAPALTSNFGERSYLVRLWHVVVCVGADLCIFRMDHSTLASSRRESLMVWARSSLQPVAITAGIGVQPLL